MASKQCNKCKEVKPLSEFNKAKRFKTGFRYQCRNCDKIDNLLYSRTKKGLIKRIYANQKTRSTKRNYPLPNYTFDELFNWVTCQQNFNKLFSDWENNNFCKNKTPSCDRLDDYKSYTLDNLHLVTWQENNLKHHNDVISGTNNKRSKAVIQMSLTDRFIAKYHSISQASRKTGIPITYISRCCLNRYGRKTSGGFKWIFD